MCPKKQSSQWLEKHDNLSYSSFDLESLRKSGLGHLIYEDKIWSPALLIENGKDIVGLKKGERYEFNSDDEKSKRIGSRF